MGNGTACRPIMSVIILVSNTSLRRPIITRMITGRIGLHSVLLLVLIRTVKISLNVIVAVSDECPVHAQGSTLLAGNHLDHCIVPRLLQEVAKSTCD